jgi:hypothetical protein
MPDQNTPAGWYPTPDGQQRYWDGSQWTNNVAPQAPQAVSPPSAKRGGPLKWVLLGLGLFLVLGIGSCIALVATAGNEVSQSLESVANELESAAPTAEPGETEEAPAGSDNSGDENNPVEIEEGKAFDVRGFSYAAGWKVTGSDFGMEVEELKVTNNRDDKDSALVDIRFWKGTEVLASVNCTSEPILTGTTVTLNCFSADKKPSGFDKITISDMF